MSGTLNENVELFSDDKNKSNSRNCQSVELFAMSPSKQILISTNGDRICPTRIFFEFFLSSWKVQVYETSHSSFLAKNAKQKSHFSFDKI